MVFIEKHVPLVSKDMRMRRRNSACKIHTFIKKLIYQR